MRNISERRQPSDAKKKAVNAKRGNRKKSPTPGATEAAAKNQCAAYEMKIRGMTYRQIAKEIGVSPKTAHKYVNDALEEYIAATAESVEILRTIELQKLDELESVLLPLALKGDLQAADRVLKIQERRAKLLGLEAPQKVEHSGHLTLEEFRERIGKANA
jgi:transposase-like protein